MSTVDIFNTVYSEGGIEGKQDKLYGLFPRGSTAGFSPLDIGVVALWYDASNLASITASGGAVSQWNDLSGNGYNVVQATGVSQPTTGTRTRNGLNVLDFNGSNVLSTGFIFGAQVSQPFTAAWTCIYDTQGFEPRLLNTNGGNNYVRLSSGGNHKLTVALPTVISDTNTLNASSYIIVVIGNGASSKVYLNGTLVISGDLGLGGFSSGFAFGESLDGALCEIDVWGANHDADVAAIFSGLNSKWAIY